MVVKLNCKSIDIYLKKVKVKSEFRDYSESYTSRMVERLTNLTLFFPLLSANVDFCEKVFIDEFRRISNLSCSTKTKDTRNNI